MSTRRPVVPRPIEKQLTKYAAAKAALDAYGALVKMSNARIEKVLTEERARLVDGAKKVNGRLEELIKQADDMFEVGDDEAWAEEGLCIDSDPLEGTIDELLLPDEELTEERVALDDLLDAAEEGEVADGNDDADE